MFNFDKSDWQRIAGALVGAIVLTAASVGAAIGPARAIEMTPVYAQAEAPNQSVA